MLHFDLYMFPIVCFHMEFYVIVGNLRTKEESVIKKIRLTDATADTWDARKRSGVTLVTELSVTCSFIGLHETLF